MKEVTLFSDDPKSKESAQQLGQVSFLGSYVGIISFKNKIMFLHIFHLSFGFMHYFNLRVKLHGCNLYLTGNCFTESLAASKYSAVLWI